MKKKRILTALALLAGLFVSVLPTGVKAAGPICSVTGGDHIIKERVVVAATCVKDGLAQWYCTACDEVISNNAIAATGIHTEVTVPGTAATCTATGLTEGKKCAVCNTVLLAQQVIDKLPHNFQNGVCVDCGAKAATPDCSVTGDKHIIKERIVTDATCGKDGMKQQYCTACDTVLVDNIKIPATGAHTEVVLPAVDATCSATGLTEGKKCSVCDTILVEQKVVDKLPHTKVTIPGREATCTQTGLTEGIKCSVCEEILVAQREIAKKNHSFVNGECKFCGAKDTGWNVPTDGLDDVPKTGDVTPIVAFGFVVVLAFSAVVIKKAITSC